MTARSIIKTSAYDIVCQEVYIHLRTYVRDNRREWHGTVEIPLSLRRHILVDERATAAGPIIMTADGEQIYGHPIRWVGGLDVTRFHEA